MPIRQIDSTVKVYTRQASSVAWVLNEKLTCLNITDGFGLIQQHTAQLKAITPGMANASAVPAEQTEIDEAKKAMRYNADVEFQITNIGLFYGSITGLWCKVTHLVDAVETTVFIGQIFASNLNFKSLLSDGITAYGIDVCLSHQGVVGSLCYDSEIGDNPINYDAKPPYFNPQGRPNMGAVNDGVNVFDGALYKDLTIEANFWTPSTIIKYLLYQLNNQIVDSTTSSKRYAYFAPLTDTQLQLENDGNVFGDEQKSSDYEIGSDSVWATMVQLVEVNGPYSLTIKYDGDFAKISVLEYF